MLSHRHSTTVSLETYPLYSVVNITAKLLHVKYAPKSVVFFQPHLHA